MPILIPHDVDKPLIYVRGIADQVSYLQLYREHQHGVSGAMLLKEICLDHTVSSTVATYAGNVPFHGRDFETYLPHHADCFAINLAIMLAAGDKGLDYLKHWRWRASGLSFRIASTQGKQS